MPTSSISILLEVPFEYPSVTRGTAWTSNAKAQKSLKNELVILLRPIVVEGASWDHALETSYRRVEQIQNRFE